MAENRMLVWQGPSALTGEHIIVLATGANPVGSKARSSSNAKTGNMIQISILGASMSPTDAIREGRDVDVCGDCIHRSKASGGLGDCYTHKNLRRGYAQTSTWQAHQRNGSLPFDVERFRGRRVRFGAYGDPAAVPFEVWEAIASVASGFTGYTHQWRTADPRFAELFMASADSEQDEIDSNAKGYRAFRIRLPEAPKLKGEVVCPASAEAGFKTECASCLQCSGTALGRKLNIVIVKH